MYRPALAAVPAGLVLFRVSWDRQASGWQRSIGRPNEQQGAGDIEGEDGAGAAKRPDVPEPEREGSRGDEGKDNGDPDLVVRLATAARERKSRSLGWYFSERGWKAAATTSVPVVLSVWRRRLPSAQAPWGTRRLLLT
jgi:hypothetical protein